MSDVDMSKYIIAKSDRQNADDFVGGPRTITITAVRASGESDQPVAVHFEGDDNKPYYPSKGMRRVMVHAWGDEAKTYVGRQMTLYLDENVMYGGMKVGGIRIGAMSHIDRPLTIALAITRGRKLSHIVKPLRVIDEAVDVPSPPETIVREEPPEIAPDEPSPIPIADMTQEERMAWVESLRASIIKHGKTPQDAMAVWNASIEAIRDLETIDQPLYDRLYTWHGERLKKLREKQA